MARHAITPDLSTRRAARRAIDRALGRVARRLPDALGAGPVDPEPVHRFRIATRRASVALRAFAPCLPGERLRHARGLLRGLRRAAARTRDLDVQHQQWSEFARLDPALVAPAGALLRWIAESRAGALEQLRLAATECPPALLRKARVRLVRAADRPNLAPAERESCAAFAHRYLACLAEDLRRRIDRGAETPEALHEARIEVKRLRYALELFRRCVRPEEAGALLDRLRTLHDLLGFHQDLVVAGHLLDEFAGVADPVLLIPLRAAIADRLPGADERAREQLIAFNASPLSRSAFPRAA
jgi:CHAD domain-containing protein